jgi:hypothetical protein
MAPTPTFTPTPTPAPATPTFAPAENPVAPTEAAAEEPEATATPKPTAVPKPTAAPKPTATPEPEKPPEKIAGSMPSTLSFKGVKLNANAQDALSLLGTPDDMFEAPSCAFEGTDRIYYYKGFEISTYPLGEQDFVLSIVITSAGKTPEGLEIGMGFDDMVAAYGEGYEDGGGVYRYTSGGQELSVFIEDGSVVEISMYYLDAAS